MKKIDDEIAVLSKIAQILWSIVLWVSGYMPLSWKLHQFFHRDCGTGCLLMPRTVKLSASSAAPQVKVT